MIYIHTLSFCFIFFVYKCVQLSLFLVSLALVLSQQLVEGLVQVLKLFLCPHKNHYCQCHDTRLDCEFVTPLQLSCGKKGKLHEDTGREMEPRNKHILCLLNCRNDENHWRTNICSDRDICSKTYILNPSNMRQEHIQTGTRSPGTCALL